MMRLTLLLLILFLSSTSRTQTNILEWESGHPLSWRDFRAPVDQGSMHAAATYSGVQYTYKYTSDPDLKFSFDAVSFFDKNRSWKNPDRINEYILAHEQLHFDISELHARMLRKAFAEKIFSERFEKEIKSIYEQNNASRRKMQTQYDDETDHSKNAEAQARWNIHIQQQLDLFNNFRKKSPDQ